jgi:hypothetical protein
MLVMAVDPGPVESAYVVWDGQRVLQFDKMSNERLLASINHTPPPMIEHLAIEKIASFGMPVGAEVFETVFWSGVFANAFGLARVSRITRNEVKNHLCHSSRAKDGNIRQAILDRFGGKVAAVGIKAAKGPLYGLSGDCWSALAVALTFYDRCPTAL